MTGTPSRPFYAQKKFDPGALGNVVQIKCEWAQRLAYRMSRRALGTLDSRLRVARATYRTTPWNASRPDAETATTSALRAALVATFRASDPEHVEVTVQNGGGGKVTCAATSQSTFPKKDTAFYSAGYNVADR